MGVSRSIEIAGTSSETEADMCSDGMQTIDECGKIDALRFFVITGFLMSLASATLLILSFSPLFKSRAALQRHMPVV